MAMVAVTTALLGFFAFVIMRVTTPQMTTLFTDLTAEDSSSIIKDLERQAIPFERLHGVLRIRAPGALHRAWRRCVYRFLIGTVRPAGPPWRITLCLARQKIR